MEKISRHLPRREAQCGRSQVVGIASIQVQVDEVGCCQGIRKYLEDEPQVDVDFVVQIVDDVVADLAACCMLVSVRYSTAGECELGETRVN